MWQNLWNKIGRIRRRKSGSIGKILPESGKSGPRPPATILLTPQRRKSMISVRSRVSTEIRKATMAATALNLKKTGVSLSNVYAGN